MKVSEGSIKFDFSGDNDMLSLTRQILLLTNQNSFVAEKKLNELFHQDGKDRVRYRPGESVSIEELKNETGNYKNALLSNIRADWLFKNVMESVSRMPSIYTRKALIIYFMNLGYHGEFPKLFQLDDELTSDIVSEESLKTLNDSNRALNNIINNFIERSASTTALEFTNLLTDLRAQTNDKISDYVQSLGNEIYFRTSSHVRDRIRSTTLYEDTPENSALLDKTMTLINDSRRRVSEFFTPTLGDLYAVFDLSASSYKKYKPEGIAILCRTFGVDLTKEVVKNE